MNPAAVMIAVSDTGTGMDEKTRTRISEPFSRPRRTMQAQSGSFDRLWHRQSERRAHHGRDRIWTWYGLQIVTYVLNLGVEGYILKTDDMSAVVRSIEEIAVGERRFSPGLTPVST